jgi:hypothetical protein
MTLVSESFDGMMSSVVAWIDDTEILVLAHHRAQQKLVRFALSGDWTVVQPTERIGTVADADANARGTIIIYNRPEHGRELYWVEAANLRRLTHTGSWLEDRTLGQGHWIS